MKNHYYASVLLLFFGTINLMSQDLKIEKPHQKTARIENESNAYNAIATFSKLYNLKKGYTYEGKTKTSDISGLSHQKFQQFYKGIKVEFGTAIVHSRDGLVVSVNGELYNSDNLDLKPKYSSIDGLQKAILATSATKYLWDDLDQSLVMNYKKPSGELVIFPVDLEGNLKLAYKYDIYALEPISREEIFIDANNGEVLYRNPIIKHTNNRSASSVSSEIASNKFKSLITGNAATRYSGTRSIETTFDAGLNKYVLNDLTRGNGIVTYNCAKTNTYPSTHFQDDNNDWTAAEFNNANKDNAALDAHWGAEKTFDFWKNIFNRNSYDDNNAQIKSYVHYDNVPGGAGYSNASWNGSVMTYGDGSNYPFTSVDVCGHEIGHAICSSTADLAYRNQSGALNEGFSDIWGACVEQYARNGNLNAPTATTSAVWKIGEDIGTSPLRYMGTPNTAGDPDTLSGTYYITTADDGTCVPASGNDNCGVHSNSGVLNHWFYILTAGKSGTNNAPSGQTDTYNVTGIGMTKSSQIAYFAERDYLTPNSTFFDARNATIAVATTLYCAGSPEVVAVTNAWNAVNVGNTFVSLANDVSLRSLNGNLNVACGAVFTPSVVFENGGTNVINSVNISYNVDGGANTVNTWNGNLALCSSQNFPLTIAGLTRGTHILNVTTTISGDENSQNNTKSVLIVVNDNGVLNAINTFENLTDALISINSSGSNLLWERGYSTKTQLTNAVAGNSKVYATKLAGLYPDKTIGYLVSQCYDFTNVLSPIMKFDMAFDLETDWDILYMQYSTNGGNSWNTLGSAIDSNWYTSNRLPNGNDCFNCIGSQWTGEGALTHPNGGTNATKRQYSYNLSNFSSASANPQSNMIFRFVFQSDDASTEDGVLIDNFVIEGTTLSIEDFKFDKFSVYPNPSNGLFNLSLSTSEKVNVSLLDVRGRSIFNQSYSSNGSIFNKEFDFNALTSGIYILKVESEGKKASKKIIIN